MEEIKNTNESETSPEIGALAEALAAAQGEIRGALKDASNPFFKSSYADLASVMDACREPLSKNKLAVVQTTAECEFGKIKLITRLIHSSGQWIRGILVMKPSKDDPQGMGSALTYARRYALSAIVGVAPEDDDGNAASGNKSNANEYAAEQKRKFDADPKNQPFRKENPQEEVKPETDTGTKPASAEQKKRLAAAGALPTFAGIQDTLVAMAGTLTFDDAEMLLASLRGETVKNSTKAKLRAMVNHLGDADGYVIDEIKFAALGPDETGDWLEDFTPLGCPFISIDEKEGK